MKTPKDIFLAMTPKERGDALVKLMDTEKDSHKDLLKGLMETDGFLEFLVASTTVCVDPMATVTLIFTGFILANAVACNAEVK